MPGLAGHSSHTCPCLSGAGSEPYPSLAVEVGEVSGALGLTGALRSSQL